MCAIFPWWRGHPGGGCRNVGFPLSWEVSSLGTSCFIIGCVRTCSISVLGGDIHQEFWMDNFLKRKFKSRNYVYHESEKFLLSDKWSPKRKTKFQNWIITKLTTTFGRTIQLSQWTSKYSLLLVSIIMLMLLWLLILKNSAVHIQ